MKSSDPGNYRFYFNLVCKSHWSFILCDTKKKYIKGFHLNGQNDMNLDTFTKYSNLNISQITNLGSFVHKVVSYKQASQEIMEHPPLYRKTKFFSTLKVFFPSIGDYKLEKQILNLSTVIEQEFNTILQTLGKLQSEMNSLASVVIQSQYALDTLTSQVEFMLPSMKNVASM